MPLEIDDRVTHELARTVEGDIAAPLDLEQLDSFALQKLRRGNEVLLFTAAAQGDDGRVLDEQEHVLRDGARNSVSRDAALKLQRLAVGQATERHRP